MRLLPIALAIVTLTAAVPATAALTTYTDRASFLAAAGPVTTETFNSAAEEASFQTSPVVFGPLSVQGYGDQLDRHFVDIPPSQFPEFNSDGTTNLSAFVTIGGGLVFTFASPITAWGADFAALQNDIFRTIIIAGGVTLTPPVKAGNVRSFYGFVSDVAFTTVTFAGSTGDGFSIDNVSFGGAAVPEPASWAMLIAGFALVGATARRRRFARAA